MKNKQFDLKVEIENVIKKYNLSSIWSKKIELDLKKYRKIHQYSKNRKDYREYDFVTIDGEDAKDFDDAVFCEKIKENWKLYVAIADVAHYVSKNSNIDKEAFNRGTSVYFPGFVIPMLPEVLSNDLCSLKPNEDKLVVVAEIVIDKSGSIKSYNFENALIKSSARLTYNVVEEFLKGRNVIQDPEVIKNINNLYSLYKSLEKNRSKRNAISFDSNEVSFFVSKSNEVESIKSSARMESQKIIEECMIAANIASSLFIKKNNKNTLYRVHDEPSIGKIEEASNSLKALGYKLLPNIIPSPREINDLLKLSKRKLDYHLVTSILLRSMARAEYTPKNIGHFGLSLKSYNHFTSPIRRYPDLIVHRVLKNIINKKETGYEMNELEKIGVASSENERTAEAAEREIQSILLCNYAKKFVGRKFTASIESIVSFGMFVTCKEEPIQGLVHISSLGNEYFFHDEIKNILIGEKSKKIYRVGDKINVKLYSAYPSERKIDFQLVKNRNA